MSQSAVLDDLAKYSHYTLWLTASTAFGDGNKTSEIIDVYTDQDSKLITFLMLSVYQCFHLLNIL